LHVFTNKHNHKKRNDPCTVRTPSSDPTASSWTSPASTRGDGHVKHVFIQCVLYTFQLSHASLIHDNDKAIFGHVNNTQGLVRSQSNRELQQCFQVTRVETAQKGFTAGQSGLDWLVTLLHKGPRYTCQYGYVVHCFWFGVPWKQLPWSYLQNLY